MGGPERCVLMLEFDVGVASVMVGIGRFFNGAREGLEHTCKLLLLLRAGSRCKVAIWIAVLSLRC